MRPWATEPCRVFGCPSVRFPVAIAAGTHPFPFRTRQLSPPAPMVLGGRPPGRVGRRRDFRSRRPTLWGGPSTFNRFHGPWMDRPVRPDLHGRDLLEGVRRQVGTSASGGGARGPARRSEVVEQELVHAALCPVAMRCGPEMWALRPTPNPGGARDRLVRTAGLAGGSGHLGQPGRRGPGRAQRGRFKGVLG